MFEAERQKSAHNPSDVNLYTRNVRGRGKRGT